jgi:Leucine-rich repeat (LRR) protein
MKTKMFFTMLLLLIFMVKVKAQSVNIQDSLALVDLYNSTNGDSWYIDYNWLTEKPVSQWYGISVMEDRVISIQLSVNNLSGSLPASMGNLSEVQYLSFFSNLLTGSIPSQMGNLHKLQQVYFQTNQLSGNIPAELGNLVKLKSLYLSGNKLSGSIPASLGNLTKLVELICAGNQLTGTIPAELSNLTKIKSLDLSGNQLIGNIPFDFSKLQWLNYLNLGNNQLTGTISPQLGQVAKLKDLDLSTNLLTGAIPSELGNLAELRLLNLNNNKLKGEIPVSLGNLELWGLNLANNRLTGSIPANIGGYNMRRLYLNNNRLSGAVPEGIRAHEYTDISRNKFTFDGMEQFANHLGHKGNYHHQAPILIIMKNNVLSVDAGGTLTNNTYVWINSTQSDSTIIIGDSVFQPTKSGKYYVKVINSIAKFLTLKSDTIEYTTTFISSVQKESNDLLTAKADQQSFWVYPNPAKDKIHIQTNSKTTFILNNQLGKTVLSKVVSGNDEISVCSLPAGLYYLKNIQTGFVKKVIITR